MNILGVGMYSLILFVLLYIWYLPNEGKRGALRTATIATAVFAFTTSASLTFGLPGLVISGAVVILLALYRIYV